MSKSNTTKSHFTSTNKKQSKKEWTIANFKKALSINSNFIETKSKLEKLLKG